MMKRNMSMSGRNLLDQLVQSFSEMGSSPRTSSVSAPDDPLLPAARASPRCPTPKQVSTIKRKLALAYGFTVVFFMVCIFFLVYSQSLSPPPSSAARHSGGFSQWKIINSFRRANSTANPAQGSHLPAYYSNDMNDNYSSSSAASIPNGNSISISSSGLSSSLPDDKATAEPHQVVDAAASSTGVSSKKERKREGRSKKKKSTNKKERAKRWVKKMEQCNLFHGSWVRDESYPLYEPGSCPLIDEPFNCFLNGRPDNSYEKYKWQPSKCRIPRLNGLIMLEMLRDKRLVFVGDSLNRNMWESLLCALRSSLPDKNRVFEVSGREEFRSESSYSFIFQDYNCSVEFFQSPFLVQEWEMPADKNNVSIKETLRIDTMHNSSQHFETADIIIFNTGHWWSHTKTMNGEGYYQEGDHVHDKLDVDIAFRKSLKTWANWVDTHIDHSKTSVIFRGYSVSHFKGGEWNSGGKCDDEIEPLTNRTYFEEDPSLVEIAESVLHEMKTPVFYLNITEMTNFRRDAHPSFYREQNMTAADRAAPSMIQDCSHWCLPGVPDTWNEIVYTHLLLRHKKQQMQQRLRDVQRRKRRHQ